MAIIKCSVCRKFYDDSKNSECPHCASSNYLFSAIDNEEKTQAMDYLYDSNNTESKTQQYYEDVHEYDKTIGVFFSQYDFNPVTAWLVCIEGDLRGKSYEVHMNRNFVGRNKLMDIAVSDDLTVSRENHFSIVFEVKTNRFYVQSGEGSISVNGVSVNSSAEIFENDILEFGKSKYLFIPYCNERRNWNNA